MDLIFDILKKLRNYELRNIRNQLKASPHEFEKVGKLFELVTRFKEKPESFYSQKLYSKEPDNTFRVTKSRLKKMMEESVLLERSLSGYSAEYTNSMLLSRKKLLQGEILLGRGAYKASKNILLQVAALARKYALHEEQFQAEMLLHRVKSVNISVREFDKGTASLLELNRLDFLVRESAILFYSLSNFLTSKTTEDPLVLRSLKEKMKRIEEIKDLTGSPHAAYYYLYGSVLYHQYLFNYPAAKQFCIKYLQLLNKEASLRSKQRIANTHFQLAEISLRMGELKDAMRYIQETLSFFPKDETNYLITLGTAYRIAFISKDFDLCQDILDEALAHPRLSVSKMRAATWHYFQACLLFKNKNYKEATRALNEATALLSDKYGWNLSFRLLEIMILFQAGHNDLLDARILNIRQFVRRTQKNSELYRPMQLIGILMDWHRNSLNLKKAWPSIRKKLDNLESHHSKMPFSTSSGELIRLEEWLIGKMGEA